MAKEHWTRKLKRENKELADTVEKQAVEIGKLKTDNVRLQKAVVNTDRGDPNAPRPDGLIISLTDYGVNDIREANNAQQHNTDAHLAILADDEVEIRVESRDDFYKYVQFAQSRDIVGKVNPEPSWNKATKYTQEWLAEHNNLEGLRITVFDPYGFMKQFDGLNIVKTYTEHEWWRTDEGMQQLADDDIQRQIDEAAKQWESTPTFWTAFIPLKEMMLDGRPVSDLIAEAMGKGSPHPARCMQRVRDAFHIEYLDGHISDYPICGFQFEGDKGQSFDKHDLNIDFACDRGQRIRVNFHGKLPNRIRKRFYRRDPKDNAVFSPTQDTGGASVEFISSE